MTPSTHRLSLYTPATYRIQVQGQLDESWSSRLGGMTIGSATSPERGPVTLLEGTLLDQASLAGVLNTLYLLGLPVISVKYIETEP